MLPFDKDKPAEAPPPQSARGSLAKRRRNARQKAMQALYQWDFDADAAPVSEIVAQFCALQNMERVDVEYFESLALYVTDHLQEIDQHIAAQTADRTLSDLDPVERAVLRVACAELISRLDIPYRVVVNESVEIAKLFGADQGHKFVNGVVDKMAAQLRAVEYGQAASQCGEDDE